MIEHASAQFHDSVLQIEGIDYIEFYAGNAYQAAHFYRTALGFTQIAYAGLETGMHGQASLVMEQHNIRLVLTSALNADSQVAEYTRRHGDGVKDIAFTVNDVQRAFGEAINRGARPVMEPTLLEDQGGQVIKATVAACGDIVHSYVQRDTYKGVFFPNYCAVKALST